MSSKDVEGLTIVKDHWPHRPHSYGHVFVDNSSNTEGTNSDDKPDVPVTTTDGPSAETPETSE